MELWFPMDVSRIWNKRKVDAQIESAECRKSRKLKTLNSKVVRETLCPTTVLPELGCLVSGLAVLYLLPRDTQSRHISLFSCSFMSWVAGVLVSVRIARRPPPGIGGCDTWHRLCCVDCEFPAFPAISSKILLESVSSLWLVATTSQGIILSTRILNVTDVLTFKGHMLS